MSGFEHGKILLCLMATVVLGGRVVRAAQSSDNRSRTPVGYVVSLHGPWVDNANGGKILTPHAAVWADSRIRVERPRADYSIFIRVYGLSAVQPYECDHATVCSGPIDLKAALDQRSEPLLASFGRVFDALKWIFSEPAPGGDSFSPRGSGEQAAQDDLVIAGAHDIKVSRLFSRLPFGTWDADFKPAGGGARALVTSIDWHGDLTLPVALQPGLYEVELKRRLAADGAVPNTEAAVVLVVKERDFARAGVLLDEGRRYIASWKDPDDDESRAILRWLMLSIATSSGNRK